jgi:hypothetical protein
MSKKRRTPRAPRKTGHRRRVGSPFLAAMLIASPVTTARATPKAAAAHIATADPTSLLWRDIGLEGVLDIDVFAAGLQSVERHGLKPRMLAIADMRQPSTAKRLYVIDLEARRLVLRTWVAHGQGSGNLMAERFSNRDGSRATSLGLYQVGASIRSPKHGPALLLDGLDRGQNDHARAREVIMHSADYVSAGYIAKHGSLGRSWGCPAVPRDEMNRIISLLANDGLLYVYGG